MTNAKSKKTTAAKPTEVRLADYLPPAYLVEETALDIDLRGKTARVKSRLVIHRNSASKDKRGALVLDGENQKLLSVTINGVTLDAQNYELTDKRLTIQGVPDRAIVEIDSSHEPASNTDLAGLYVAGPMLVTQCESEGFRRITYYPDRPDVLAKFRVTIHADQKTYPTLLSNGNLIKKGREKGGRHYVVWEDPFPKPCYLFALVAGKLDRAATHHTTRRGRKILIEMYVEPGKKGETGLALAAIKKAMAWDEKTYGLEYDLDRYMMVAVSYYNMGAMENKGLTVFNDTCILGTPETATDADIAFFDRVVAHEHFHNWTGNRVTCRDWFQLSLKEGLTVFREHEYMGDMNGRTVERINAVEGIRRAQFPEDASPMSHAVRPSVYQAIDNFYTMTVYHKGAEVIRMIQTLVGKKGFRKGMDLYFKRHDGQAATCDDFVAAMADVNGIDLSHFMLWYEQAGTPILDVSSHYDAKKKEYTVRVKQHTPPTHGQSKKRPLYMPFSIGLLDQKGRDMKGTFVIDLSLPEEKFVFLNVEEKPVPSLLRDFSAPVRLNYAYTDAELRLLMANDADGFNRWDAAQQLYTKYILNETPLPEAFLDSLRAVLADKKMDAATKALMLTLPSETELGSLLVSRGQKIDPMKLYQQRQRVLRAMAEALQEELWAIYETIDGALGEKECDGIARGLRSLKNLCLAYLSKILPDDVEPLLAAAVATSRNMTEKMFGLELLAESASKLGEKMLALYAKQYAKEPIIMDNWLNAIGGARRADVLAQVKKAMKNPVYSITNPNRVSALLGPFVGNPFGFHAADGSGYAFVGAYAAKLDKINPQAAARFVKPLARWRDYEPKRQKMIRHELKKLSAIKGLSENLREIVGRALAVK